MTEQDKQLLLKDLCPRLPYGVKFTLGKNIYTIKGIDLIVTDEGDWEYAVTEKGIEPIEIKYLKPYLRPMSSMTEEEKNDYINTFTVMWDAVDWLNAHHFDFRNLISKGLAIDCTNLNIY